MRLVPVFKQDELRDALTDTLKIFALLTPDASFVCSIKPAIAGMWKEFHPKVTSIINNSVSIIAKKCTAESVPLKESIGSVVIKKV